MLILRKHKYLKLIVEKQNAFRYNTDSLQNRCNMNSKKKQKRISYVQILVLGFAGVILAGAVLLSLPISSATGTFTPFIDAVFTATSATCVTGLVVFNTATYWSTFGQLVIMLLIQIGGLGFISVTALYFVLTHKKVGLSHRELFVEALGATKLSGIMRVMLLAIRGTFCIEGIGALLLSFRFVPQYGWARGIYYSIFHAVSAFCNAGFDLLGFETPFCSLTNYVEDTYVCAIIMALIVIGGLGFFVWEDILQKGFHFKRYALHTKMVLCFTAVLIVVPAIFFFIWEKGNTMADLTDGEAVVASLFQSITCRTAGFNTIDLVGLKDSSSLLSIVLMVIGGSPGSTAGGIKTTTMFVMLLSCFSKLRKRKDINIFGRRIPSDALDRAQSIITIYMLVSFVGVIVLIEGSGVALGPAMFEIASAIGTVGLTQNVTGTLMASGKIAVSMIMLFGRVGGLSMLMALALGNRAANTRYPEEMIMIG